MTLVLHLKPPAELKNGEDAVDWIKLRRTAGLDDHAIAREFEELVARGTWREAEELPEKPPARRGPARSEDEERDDTNPIGKLLGTRDAKQRLLLDPAKTLPTAEAVRRDMYTLDGFPTLHAQGAEFLVWREAENRYQTLEAGELDARILREMHFARQPVLTKKGELDFVDVDANPRTCGMVRETLRAISLLAASTPEPSWIGDVEDQPPAEDVLSFPACNLRISDGRQFPKTPRLFSRVALDYNYDPSAPEPKHLLRFLHEALEGDNERIALAQEWAGYLLTSDTSQQKILVPIGPKRAGKSTYARLCEELVGRGNAVWLSSSALAHHTGRACLIGASYAVIPDARFTGKDAEAVVESLLAISGEDRQTIPRKYLPDWTGKLRVRFSIVSNEEPRLPDASSALLGRMLVLRFSRSFYGAEDPALAAKLRAERPSHLNWALAGLRRLRERGHFLEPRSSLELKLAMEEHGAPVATFARQRCSVGPGHKVLVKQLYAEWKSWCVSKGWTHVPREQAFGRDLRAAFSAITKREGTGGADWYHGIALVDGMRHSSPPHTPSQIPFVSNAGEKGEQAHQDPEHRDETLEGTQKGNVGGSEGVRPGAAHFAAVAEVACSLLPGDAFRDHERFGRALVDLIGKTNWTAAAAEAALRAELLEVHGAAGAE